MGVKHLLVALMKNFNVDPLSRNLNDSFKSSKYIFLLMLGISTKKFHGEKQEELGQIITTSCMQKFNLKQQKNINM
jgi:hypothetical protein